MTFQCLKGDCLELMRDLSDNSVDLFTRDLSYDACRLNFEYFYHEQLHFVKIF
jgi:hypothetical protein